VIINTTHRFILFSINKTATSSMDEALAGYFDADEFRRRALELPRLGLARRRVKDKEHRDRLIRYGWNEVPALKHAPVRWLKDRWDDLAPEVAWNEMYKVCFVRNPFERLLSVYSYHTQTLSQRFPDAQAAGSFEAWLQMGGTGSARLSMKDFIHDDHDALLVDKVGRYETLSADWTDFTTRVGLPGLKLPHTPATRSRHLPCAELATPQLRDLILANPVWRADVEYFGY